jgi:hypothetical protein
MTRLPADYLADAEKRARRYMGQWTGTAGSLAADVIRLLHERTAILTELSNMTQQLEDANAQIRRAIEVRREAVAAGKPHDEWYEGLEAGCCDGGKCHAKTFDTTTMDATDEPPQETSIPVDWILRGEQELQAHDDDIRWPGDSIVKSPPEGLRPGSREFLAILDELRALHLANTLDYGVDEDALSNIRSSADVVNMPAWAGCILRISDKMHRLKAFFRRGKCEFDGVEDTLKDIACYAAIALVLHREKTTP